MLRYSSERSRILQPLRSISFIAAIGIGMLNASPPALAQIYKNSLSCDGFGKFLISYGPGIAYERTLTPHFGLGTGVSIAEAGTISDFNNKVRRFVDLYIPLYAVGGFGERHRLVGLAGATFLLAIQPGSIQNNSYVDYRDHIIPFLGVGYELNYRRLLFRVPGYLLYIGENAWFPSVVPWIGVSVGVRF